MSWDFFRLQTESTSVNPRFYVHKCNRRSNISKGEVLLSPMSEKIQLMASCEVKQNACSICYAGPTTGTWKL